MEAGRGQLAERKFEIQLPGVDFLCTEERIGQLKIRVELLLSIVEAPQLTRDGLQVVANLAVDRLSRLADERPIVVPLQNALQGKGDQHARSNREKLQNKILHRMNRSVRRMDFHSSSLYGYGRLRLSSPERFRSLPRLVAR
jgi:hypothetical protein